MKSQKWSVTVSSIISHKFIKIENKKSTVFCSKRESNASRNVYHHLIHRPTKQDAFEKFEHLTCLSTDMIIIFPYWKFSNKLPMISCFLKRENYIRTPRSPKNEIFVRKHCIITSNVTFFSPRLKKCHQSAAFNPLPC